MIDSGSLPSMFLSLFQTIVSVLARVILGTIPWGHLSAPNHTLLRMEEPCANISGEYTMKILQKSNEKQRTTRPNGAFYNITNAQIKQTETAFLCACCYFAGSFFFVFFHFNCCQLNEPLFLPLISCRKAKESYNDIMQNLLSFSYLFYFFIFTLI